MIVEEVMRHLAKKWDEAEDRGDANVVVETSHGPKRIKDFEIHRGEIHLILEE